MEPLEEISNFSRFLATKAKSRMTEDMTNLSRVHTTLLGPERFRNATGRPCSHLFHCVQSFRNEPTTSRCDRSGTVPEQVRGVNAQPGAFRWRLASPCVIMKNMQYIFPKKVCPAKNRHSGLLWYLDFGTRSKHLERVSNPNALRRFPVFVIPKS